MTFFFSLLVLPPQGQCALSDLLITQPQRHPHVATYMHTRECARVGAHTLSPSPHLSTPPLLPPSSFSSVQSSAWSTVKTLMLYSQDTTVTLQQGQVHFLRVSDIMGGDAACLVSWATRVNRQCWKRHLLYCNLTNTFPTANDMSSLFCPRKGVQNLTG